MPDDPSQGIYVWIDALVNYLTAEGFPWTDGQQSAWPADAHVVGKDIIRFHAIYWPCILLAAGLPLPKSIVTHSHWTKNKAKISKSTGNIVDPFAEIDRYGKDVVRYYLCRMGGNLEKDSDYSEALLKESHDKWLAGQLGNMIGRVCGPPISRRVFKILERGQSRRVKLADESGQTAKISRPSSEHANQALEEQIQALGGELLQDNDSFASRCFFPFSLTP